MIISATEKKETDQVESAVHHAQTSDDNPPPMETGTVRCLAIEYIHCKVTESFFADKYHIHVHVWYRAALIVNALLIFHTFKH